MKGKGAVKRRQSYPFLRVSGYSANFTSVVTCILPGLSGTLLGCLYTCMYYYNYTGCRSVHCNGVWHALI